MANPWRNCDREELELELRTSKSQELLRGLQATEPFLRQFRTWGDVVTFAIGCTSKDPLKDKVLRPIFRAYRSDHESGWLAILLVIFWSNLESISRWKCRWDEDPEELQQNVASVFLDVVRRLDVDRRPARLAQKIVNDTIHYVYQAYKRRWSRTNRETTTDPSDIEALVGGVNGIDVEAIDLREAHEREINRLREHLDAGRITDASFLLIVGTRLYGESVAEYARRVGLNYEVAKKRRQRAEAAIRRFDGSTQ